ncbi:MAG: 3-oxoacyl-[acyl-carrier-protein] reductase [Clostridia bacterium]
MEDNKVALVTGGTRGIGRKIAEKFAENGYDLVLNYVSDNVDLEAINEAFKKYNNSVLILKADVSKYEECENLVKEAINKFGKVDVLVNNAGITKDGLIAMMKEENFSKVMDVNLKGTFNMCRNLVPYMMKKKSGNIVNISSVVGVVGNAGQSNYAASKAGIIGFSKSLAKELAGRNIRVNAVAPGFIDTDMTSVLTDKVKENIYSQIPLKRMGEAKEVANVVYFLSSEESSYITGQVINVDGGMVM